MVKIVRREMQAWYAKQQRVNSCGPIDGYCLWWAATTVRVLKRYGLPAQLQAGSASWPIVSPEDDDGIMPTHFSYVFEAGPTAAMRLVNGLLPEMHCWAAIGTTEIVDATTRYWPSQCQRTTGMEWRTAAPPDYLWSDAASMPAGVSYVADEDAMRIAYGILRDHLPGIIIPRSVE